ncbi:MAG: heparan-alpha-glucosaminide N-acetyltransferase domain-containing protein [Corynebacterium sp.]|uniref:heparan-alpha-glucosaminide N-acetyltransferase domain-containing protein n=1 Tax=Corynebacterium sp. TaxID=1720 RepID=UPI0026DEA714|nr:heparan-alpha-glucosaminide N-acetyltransferase domain-containing protein [Corynebacterium sp.]MDO5669130.1 heparan-alpha-glucosaminide N-acetyltransferase domain-containing protein [Corynebacterium sp.]
MTLQVNTRRPELQVPEGDLTPGEHPQPGPRPARDIWSGAIDPTDLPEEEVRTKKLGRLLGLDAVRGFALLGMIVVHVAPPVNPYTGDPTFLHALFSGRAAALFAIMAGLALALVTGRDKPHTGARWRSSAVALLIRAMMIFALGLSLNHLELPVYNILPYYGLLFILAIPFTVLNAVKAFVLAAIMLVLGPVLMFAGLSTIPFEADRAADWVTLFTRPSDLFLSMLVGGTYPAVTWITFVLVGIGLGRLPLGTLATQIYILIIGTAFLLIAPMLSNTLLVDFGGWGHITEKTPGFDIQRAYYVDVYGPETNASLPTDTWWWLATDGPHTNTPLALLGGIGFGLIAIGLFLLLAQVAGKGLTPLIATGSMSLTLYAVHLVTMGLIHTADQPYLWTFVQLLVAGFFATFWYFSVGRGPLEGLVSTVSKGVARRSSRPAVA